jgi:hypothetical protein
MRHQTVKADESVMVGGARVYGPCVVTEDGRSYSPQEWPAVRRRWEEAEQTRDRPEVDRHLCPVCNARMADPAGPCPACDHEPARVPDCPCRTCEES